MSRTDVEARPVTHPALRMVGDTSSVSTDTGSEVALSTIADTPQRGPANFGPCSCGKIAYPSRAAALVNAKRATVSGNLRAYRCPAGCWHLTSQSNWAPRQRDRQRRTEREARKSAALAALLAAAADPTPPRETGPRPARSCHCVGGPLLIGSTTCHTCGHPADRLVRRTFTDRDRAITARKAA